MDAPLQFADIAEPRPDAGKGWPKPTPPSTPRSTAGDRAAALADWDRLRRRYDTWSALVHLRFAQNTADATAKADRDYADALSPEAAELEVALKRRLLADADRPAVAGIVGDHALRLWETDVTTFDPVIKPDLEEESRVSARYTELLASAKLEFAGQTLNLAGLGPYAEDPNRETRYQAEKARWGFFEANAAELDDIYDQLVKLRTAWRASWGSRRSPRSGITLLRRVDYGPDDVARYREQVAEHVVPLVGRAAGGAARGKRLGPAALLGRGADRPRRQPQAHRRS